jgi:small nuclear ribonucleoprotein (snRNP)-like protein
MKNLPKQKKIYMEKPTRKEPVMHKLIKLIDDQSDLLKVQADRTDRLFKIIKGMEVTIKDQQEYIGELTNVLDASNKILHPYAEKIKKASNKITIEEATINLKKSLKIED